MAKQIYEQMKDFFSRHDGKEKFELGLNHIDCMVENIGKGKVIVIAGRSIDGRNEMLYTLMKNLAIDRRVPSLILNLAKTEDVFYSQFMSNVGNISFEDLQVKDIINEGEALKNANLYIDFPTDRSTENLESTIREYAGKGIELVFIDLFQAIDYKGNMMWFDEEELIYFCERSSKRLHALAKDLGINIIIGAALSYSADDREGIYEPMPQYKDMTIAGRLDEFSDLILGVFVPYAHQILCDGVKDLRDVIYVSILKNRINTKMGKFSMRYDFYHNRVVDDKQFNRLLLEELKKNNESFNELIVNLDFRVSEEI